VGPHQDEGVEGLQAGAEVDAGQFAPVDLGLGPGRGLDAAERPEPGGGVVGPDEPQYRAVGAFVAVLGDAVVVQGPGVDRPRREAIGLRGPAVADEVVDGLGQGIGPVGLVPPPVLGVVGLTRGR